MSIDNLVLEEAQKLMMVKPHPFCSVVIVSAGKGTRMESRVNKVYLNLEGKKIIERTLQEFEDCDTVDEIILVVNQRDMIYCETEIVGKNSYSKLKEIVAGGEKRQDSVYNGLKKISALAEVVLIHDGARPLVTMDIMERSILDAYKYGAITVGVPVKDTIKVVEKDGVVAETLERNKLWNIQTPQGFRREIIEEAYEKAITSGFEATDDAMIAEMAGYKVKIVHGSYENIKITTPEDMAIAEAILKYRNLM